MGFSPNFSDASLSELHSQALQVNRTRVQAEWELSHLLMEMESRHAWNELGYASVVEYSERELALDAGLTLSLLRLATDLRPFALLREAWRNGRIGRSKLREVLRAANQETESWWLSFASTHNCREVERKVALSPRAHAAQAPIRVLDATMSASTIGAQQELTQIHLSETVKTEALPTPQAALSVDPSEPVSAKERGMVRLQLVFEAHEYAIVEAALDLIAAGGGSRRREKLLTEMARRVLAHADARTRRRHAIVVERDSTTGRVAYVTERGYLPAALSDSNPAGLPGNDTMAACEKVKQTPKVRARLPQRIESQIFERAGFVCERCGTSRRLQIHHKTSRCDGGGNETDNLLLICKKCHQTAHEGDFATDIRYIAALQRARRKKEKGEVVLRTAASASACPPHSP